MQIGCVFECPSNVIIGQVDCESSTTVGLTWFSPTVTFRNIVLPSILAEKSNLFPQTIGIRTASWFKPKWWNVFRNLGYKVGNWSRQFSIDTLASLPTSDTSTDLPKIEKLNCTLISMLSEQPSRCIGAETLITQLLRSESCLSFNSKLWLSIISAPYERSDYSSMD